MASKKKVIQQPVIPMTLGTAMHTCHINEKAALENIPYKVRVAFTGISLHGTQISFSPDGDYLEHEEAVKAVKMLLELLTGVQNSSKL